MARKKLGYTKSPVPSAKRARLGSGTAILFVIVSLVIAVGLFFLLRGVFSRSDLDGLVHNVHWERSLVIEQLSLVQDADWFDDIPEDASLLGCELEYRYTSDEPAENSVEVCGTPYTVDTGDGLGDVVQDCVYEVYEEYCEYEVEDWVTYDTIQLQGDSLSIQSPVSQLIDNQREGKQVERYKIMFDTDEGSKTFNMDDYALFSQCRIGSRWVLTLDGFGKIKEIEPYR
ncbi:MAG TPA: hypothetical protein G4N92_07400 [Anaerolineae bacterium]|nr:hypothetical protein [Anaerolineae bacterium]